MMVPKLCLSKANLNYACHRMFIEHRIVLHTTASAPCVGDGTEHLTFYLIYYKLLSHLLGKYDPVIIESTKGFVLGLSTALFRYFLKRCTMTKKIIGTI